jgi:hypothetical protein
MIALGGFAVGYLLGAKAGKKGLDELTEAWGVIRQSKEFQMVLSGATTFGGNWMRGNVDHDVDYGEVVSGVAGHVMDLIQRRAGLRVVS